LTLKCMVAAKAQQQSLNKSQILQLSYIPAVAAN
jgi:hypothetical protein